MHQRSVGKDGAREKWSDWIPPNRVHGLLVQALRRAATACRFYASLKLREAWASQSRPWDSKKPLRLLRNINLIRCMDAPPRDREFVFTSDWRV